MRQTILITLVTLSLWGCDNSRPPFPPLPPTTPTEPTPTPEPPKPPVGGPWAEFCLKHSPAPTCGGDTIPICVRKQNGKVILGYVWECLPKSWYPSN